MKNDGKKEILERTAKEYYLSAEEDLSKGRNNSAAVLFFKSLVSLADLRLLIETGETPSSHSERFAVAKNMNFLPAQKTGGFL